MDASVVDLDSRREQRTRDEYQRPSDLKWVAGEAFYVAHRKSGAEAACGARGDLMLAPPGVPLCVECYPLAERAT